eukprot:1380425-Amorphochlora_amoeboformis.AAC.1
MGCSQPANQQSENVVPRAASGSENHDVMLVTVPLNHIPGRPLSINTLQGPMTVHVPPTVGPGQKFHCKVPRTASNSTSNRSGIYQKNNNSQTNPIYTNRNQANPYPGGPRAGSHSHSPNMQPAHERKRTHSGTHAPYANQYTNQRSEPNLALHYQVRKHAIRIKTETQFQKRGECPPIIKAESGKYVKLYRVMSYDVLFMYFSVPLYHFHFLDLQLRLYMCFSIAARDTSRHCTKK